MIKKQFYRRYWQYFPKFRKKDKLVFASWKPKWTYYFNMIWMDDLHIEKIENMQTVNNIN